MARRYKRIFDSSFKKSVTLVIVMVGFSSVQAQKGWIVGTGPTSKVERTFFGGNARLFYGLNDNICFGPEVAFFPYKQINGTDQTSIIDLNFNAHYIFEVTEELGFYPVTGVNYTIEKERLIEFAEENTKENEFGWNYGLGTHYNFGNFYIFTEFKGIIGNLNEEFITMGALISLSKSEKNEISQIP